MPTTSVATLMVMRYEIPYKGAKEMLLVDNLDDKGFLKELFEAMYDDTATTVSRETESRQKTAPRLSPRG